MALYIFRSARQWGTRIVGIVAESVGDAITLSSEQSAHSLRDLQPDELIATVPMNSTPGTVFDEYVDDPTYEG